MIQYLCVEHPSLEKPLYVKILPNNTVWGLSLWGFQGDNPTWKYRTQGCSLSEFNLRYPNATMSPDYNRAEAL